MNWNAIIQRLNELTTFKNNVETNSKKIPQLANQTDGTKYVAAYNETSEVTEKFNLSEALAGLNTLTDGITAQGLITRDANVFTFETGFEWRINGIDYANATNIDLTVEDATTDYYRIDIAVVDTNNLIYLIQGIESDAIPLQPQTPNNTLLLCVFNVFGNSIEDPLTITTLYKEVKLINFSEPYTLTQPDAVKFLVLESAFDVVLPLGLFENPIFEIKNTSGSDRAITFDTNIVFKGNPIIPNNGLCILKKLFSSGIVETWSVNIVSESSGATSWGSITGTLSAQTDLQTELDGKIPLTGTEVGSPITGDLEMPYNEGKGLVYKDSDLDFGFRILDYPRMVFQSIVDSFINIFQIQEESILISSDKSNFKGIEGLEDYTPNLTDLCYPQKIYVDTGLETKQPLLTNPITGTGNSNRLPKFTALGVIGNSILQEVMTNAKGISIQIVSPTNTSFGYNVLGSASLSGSSNTGFGHNILSALTTGSNNSAFGYDVLKAITNGNNNTGFGFNCLSALLTGSENNSFGYLCFNNLTSGSANVAFGVGTARFIADGVTALTTCNQSVFLGNLTKALANNSLNEIVIGYNAIGNGNNSATLGSSAITKTILRGNVLIGTTTDNGVDKLQINGTITASQATLPNQVVTLGQLPNNIKVWKSGIDGVTVANTLTITPTYTQLIPANTFESGDVVEVAFRTTAPGAKTSASNNYVYVNTTSDLITGSPLQLAIYTGGATSRTMQLERRLAVKGATTRIVNPAGTLSSDIGVSGAMTSLTIDWTVDQYFIFAIGHTVADQTLTGDFYRIIKN